MCVPVGRDEATRAERAGRHAREAEVREKSEASQNAVSWGTVRTAHTATLYSAVRPAGRQLRFCLSSGLLRDTKN